VSSHETDFDCGEGLNAAAYVLGALDDPEPYRRHLAACEACRAEVADLQRVVDSLPATVAPEVAPDALRERILETVRTEAALLRAAGPSADAPPRATRSRLSRRASYLGASAAIAGIVAAAVIALSAGSSPSERVSPGQVAASLPGARAAVHQTGGRSELVVSGMPQPPLGKIYEVWLARRGAPPQATDVLFGVTSRGLGSVNVPNSPRGVSELLVTSEPVGGSVRPTGPPLIRVQLRA
jgi:Anti-sigma-K factor rskA